MTTDAAFEAASANPLATFNSFEEKDVLECLSGPVSMKSALFAYSSLLVYITENFTGPSLVLELKPEVTMCIYKSLPENYMEEINLDGEIVHSASKLNELLYIAYTGLKKHFRNSVYFARAAITLQKVLTGPSPTLKDEALELLTGVERLIMLYHLHLYSQLNEEIEAFKKSINFDYQLIGKLGKRTKFQQKSHAQLVLQVNTSYYTSNPSLIPTIQKSDKNSEENDKIESESDTKVESSQKVEQNDQNQQKSREVHFEEDSHLLERVKLDEESEPIYLTPTEKQILLLEANVMAIRSALDETREARRVPLIIAVLNAQPSFSEVTRSLYLKSIIEKSEHSKQQRSAIQIDSLLNDFESPNPPAQARLVDFFQLDHQTLWDTRREHGLQMLSIGAARTAAKVFAEYKMWDELSAACQIAQDARLALDILEKTPQTPHVLTIIGELTENAELLEQAWELSNHRYSRAQRSLARIQIHKENWEAAINHFETALAINSLYPEAWFSLGCAAMRVEKFEKAIAAFQQVVSQKDEDAESFSNLSSCFTTIGKHDEAHSAITQAIRFDRQNHKIWENFIVISLNAEKMNDIVFGIEELNSVQPKWANVALINEVIKKVRSSNGDSVRLAKALERVGESADCGWDFWTIYSDLIEDMGALDRALEMRSTAIKCLEKEGRVLQLDDFARLVYCAEKLVKTAERIEGASRGAKQRVRVLVKKYEEYFGTTEEYEILKELLN